MSLQKEGMDTSDRMLLIFGRYAYIRRTLAGLTEGKTRLFLPAEETGLTVDITIILEGSERGWRIEGKELSENNPFYFYTEEKEKFLLLLARKADCLMPTGRIRLKQETKIQIGSAFKNRIFYECYSLIEAEHGAIAFEDNAWVLQSPGLEGIYLNGKAFTGKKRIRTGDSIDIYGIHILVLKELLVCVTFCGISRIVQRKDILQNEKTHGEAWKKREERWIERRCIQEKELHTGEVEVMMPDQPAVEPKQPLILSLGPSLTMVLPMLLMAQLSSRFMEGMGSNFYYLSVAMSISSAFLALFWGIANYGYRKHTHKKEGREKERQYKEYLDGIENYFLSCQKDNREILEKKYPALTALLGKESGRQTVLWNRYYRQKDFLSLRIGEGDMPFQVSVKLSNRQKGIIQGKLANHARELAERFLILDHVPIVADLYENRQVGIVGNLYKEKNSEILLQILVQIAACHCYTEIKTVCFYHKDRMRDREIADCIRWMPHSWSQNRKVRFLAGDDEEAAQILPVLTRELVNGKDDPDKGMCIPWYIVIVLNEKLLQGETFYRCLTDPKGNCPASVIFAGMEREELPKSCRYFISNIEQNGELLNLGSDRINRQKMVMETCSGINAQKYVRSTAGFRVRETEIDRQLPEQVHFLQLYGCGRVEELESGKRWKQSRTEERIKVPIGCGAGGNIVSLDVHEKFHGPHGLIAGTTGSGKSELLQTYLLSIAVSFSPADVNFFMIDYKGGGTGNLLKGLPHCAGVISNLSGNQIKRAMSAIISENKRRQALLGNYQVNHIDAYTKLYRKGKAKDPMPHLILVVDEFAELKKEEPEFMQEIISLAQVGRSLGVHLILATQKPAGTVDDKIWSNARFRLCLRVQDRQDSLDMLHNGDAALLISPGQCYMQIGNHEHYELFQTGYCGGNYVEEGKRGARAALLKNTGKREEAADEMRSSEGVSQIETLVSYVNRMTQKYDYSPAQSLWLPELPERVTVENLKSIDEGQSRAFGEEELKIVLGLCDDPGSQQQFTYWYQPQVHGHMAVCGGPATGKTTLVKTLLWQLAVNYTPEEVLIMIINIGQETFSSFPAMPNCLGVLKEKEEKEIFFYHLAQLIDKRKRTLSGVSCQQYNQSGKGRLPSIFLIIDNFYELNKILKDGQQELLIKLAAEGLTLGIYLILSAAAPGETGGRLYEKIKTTIALEMSDRFQYGDILRQYHIPVFPKANQKGRGLCRVQGKILEFQTALALEEQEDHAYAGMIEKRGREMEQYMRREGKDLPEKFPVIPKKADYGILTADFDWKEGRLPLGYCLSTGQLCSISIGKAACFLISGGDGTGRGTLLRCLLESALYQNHLVVLMDTGKRFPDFREREKLIYLAESAEMEDGQAFFERKEQREKKVCVFISDMEKFCRFLYHFGEAREERIGFWEEAARGKGDIALLAGIYHPGRDYEAAGTIFFKEFTAWQQGIHLGGNASAQRALAFDDLGYARQNQHEPAGIGYLKEGPGRSTRRLLLPKYKNGEETENDFSGYTDPFT